MNDRERRRREARCSFCGKRQDEVRKLVAGPGVYICDQCIRLCGEVLEEDLKAGSGPKAATGCAPPPPRPRRRWPFGSRSWRAPVHRT